MVASLLARFLGNSPLSVQVTWGEETLREPGSGGERWWGGSGGQGAVLGKEECGSGLQERWGLERAKIRQSIWRGEKREAPAFQTFLTICF